MVYSTAQMQDITRTRRQARSHAEANAFVRLALALKSEVMPNV